MKLLIVGSRSIDQFDLSPYIPPETELIISGGARGVDELAERYADEHKISKLSLRPQYERYGKGAPLRRNETMVDIADRVLIIWDGESRGTRYTMRDAEKKGKPLALVVADIQEKKRVIE